jgi:DNA-binding IclR family transcriptional regulator
MSQSVGRALRLLIELGHGARSLDDLAETLGVHKSTVLRLLRTLEADRFVRRDEHHRFSLGSRLFELGSTALEQHTLREVALPELTRLGRETGGQAVHLAVLEGSSPVYIAKVESTSSVRMYSRVGLPAALHATAVGKVLASGLSEPRLDAVLAETEFPAFTDRTITDSAAYRAELEQVRRRGWSEDAGEHEAFINCVGAPVRDPGGRVVAAVSISVPDMILDRDQVRGLVPQLLATAAAIEAAWAGSTIEPTHQERTTR